MSPKSPSGEIQSLVRAVAILDCFRIEQPQLGVREVARQLNMSSSTVGRLLATLCSTGILNQDPKTRLYRIGSKVMAWSAVYTSVLDVRQHARPMLEELHRLTNETVSLYVLERLERVCVDRIESPEHVRVVVRVGERMPLHAGSAGKALLAFVSPELIAQILSQPLERMTANTITNRQVLLQELESIRKRGYATSHGERFDDAIGLAAPIFDAGRKVIAVLNVAGPMTRFTDEHVARFAPMIIHLANQVSLALGYTGPTNILGGNQ